MASFRQPSTRILDCSRNPLLQLIIAQILELHHQ
jgi:hypothetical protein